jgi:8-oxo-dGTP pyrophosphatase MutT (NUDIX family)
MEREPKKLYTLAIPHDSHRVLLGMKKIGFGEGRWNGFGGSVNLGETVVEAAVRELYEESGLTAKTLYRGGVLTFDFEDSLKVLEVHLFHVGSFRGTPIETDEMRPQWFSNNKIPYDQMWPDDQHWLPNFLQERIQIGNFHFIDQNRIRKYLLRSISS